MINIGLDNIKSMKIANIKNKFFLSDLCLSKYVIVHKNKNAAITKGISKRKLAELRIKGQTANNILIKNLYLSSSIYILKDFRLNDAKIAEKEYATNICNASGKYCLNPRIFKIINETRF